MWGWLFLAAAIAVVAEVAGAGAGAARLVCYVENGRTDGFSECTHLVYTGEARGEKLDSLLKEYRTNNPRLKIILRVSDVDKDLRALLKSKHAQGLEIYEAHKSINRTKVLDVVETARKALSSSGGGPLLLALPAHPELLAKYYDLRSLVKKVDLMMVQTHALGMVKKMTYHPSRLSGLWDMMNTDSVVDLVVGLGVPPSKIVISIPATARQFTLQNETLSTPGSPAVEDEPKEIDQAELCRQLQKGRWTLERDQDLSAPYAFKAKTWISFEDASSVDVKGKYARVRGLAGLALRRAERDEDTPCGSALRVSLAKVLNQQSRAPRAAVLRSLEHEILSAPAASSLALQLSPYRITQVVDSDGVIHSIREDTRTEFSCSRQGYFVHPRSCARFYRCVKFDQLSADFTVFEFDCPAGLAFDARHEVCVWPGTLAETGACPGSSEIAPVPRERFTCPEHEGYYADPENCRWFFACLDHGKSPLTAYEFRCPFGLGFDAEKLKCDWPWLVPACGHIARYEAEAFGYSGAALSGGFHGQSADAVNIAAHNSLASGAALTNHVGIQGGYLSANDALDSNYISSQELSHQGHHLASSQGLLHHGLHNDAVANTGFLNVANTGLLQPTNYNTGPKYSSGSIILDDYRFPTKAEAAAHASNTANQNQYNRFTSNDKLKYSTNYEVDNSGAYVHDPTGDYAEPYKHVDSPAVPYNHDGSYNPSSGHVEPYKHIGSPAVPYIHDGSYKQSGDYYDYGKYSSQSSYEDHSGQYLHVNSGDYAGYKDTGKGAYRGDDSGKYVAGVYRTDGHIGDRSNIGQYQGSYSNDNAGAYLSDAKAYTGSSHTLTAGAINVGLVGKTSLVDAGYTDQNNYRAGPAQSFSQQTLHNAHLPIVSQPAVYINHVGTDGNNLDGYGYVTTPTSSVIPTTATPIAVSTTPVTTYKTTYVPEPPKTSFKQIFGYSQPAVTFVQPTVVAVQEPSVQVTNYNQGFNYQGDTQKYSENSGYDYSKPSIKFEEGITQTTPTPIVVSTFKPSGFSHNQHTFHQETGYQYPTPVPVTEEPFKKIVAYTTGPSVTYQPTVSTYIPQSFSQQTLHKVDNQDSGYVYSKPSIGLQPETVQYTTAQPVEAAPSVVSTYQPQIFSQSTVHKVDANQITQNAGHSYGKVGYNYPNPSSGYDYPNPAIKFEEGQIYSTPAPVVSTYQPQTYSHQTLHKIEQQSYVPSSTPLPNIALTYKQPAVTIYQNPILKYAEKVQPITYAQPSQSFSQQTIHKVESSNSYLPPDQSSGYVYEQPKTVLQYTTAQPTFAPVVTNRPNVYSHQTLHKVEASKVNTYSENSGYQYEQPNIQSSGYHYEKPAVQDSGYVYEQPKNTFEYTTAQPTLAPTYRPDVYSHQTLHKVEASKLNAYSENSGYQYEQPAIQSSGYHYEKPAIKFEEAPKVYQYSTPAPIVSSYKTPAYSQVIHKQETQHVIPVSSTSAPKGYFPPVTVYENPILKYAAPVKSTPAVFTQPIVQQHQVSHVVQPVQQNYDHGQDGYYSQPEIQRSIETLSSAKGYSDASLVSHQVYHQSAQNYNAGKDSVFVSTTPANLVYEDHYVEPEIKSYRAPEYIPPKTYSISTAAPAVQQSAVYHQTQEQYDYKPDDYSQQFDTVQHSFSTTHQEPKNIESIHLSSYPDTKITTKYNQIYSAPEIQVGYKSEEYLPPVVSTPIVTSTYRPTYSTVSTTSEYLPPTKAAEYLPPKDENLYLPPSSTVKPHIEYLPPSSTARPFVTSTTPKFIPSTTFRAPDYLPPQEETASVVNFESFGLKNTDDSYNIRYNPYQEYTVSSTTAPVTRKSNIVVETVKSNLLGFGTVGPDAGLVSPFTYTTSVPISSTYLPSVEISSQIPVRRLRPKYKSTTEDPYVESTTAYKAPEYLPPSERTQVDADFLNYELRKNPYTERTVVSTSAPRKHNIVIQTAKANLGYSTTSSPIISSTEAYVTPKIVTSTYAPIKQELVEISPPVRRVKPKVAVVTKINDFNPLLVRKLGAVCSCQSPTVVLKGRRPSVQVQQEYDDDYNNDYEDGRGDIQDDQYAQRLTRVQPVKSVTVPTITTSSINPIIVPDDSFYQDYQEAEIDITPRTNQGYSENYVSSTTPVAVTTEKYRIRPRVKAVTVSPTYKTVLLNEAVTPVAIVKDVSSVDTPTFDRYGPGGLRSRDETLQGSVDCKRAGLFRHPKQCNKFYSCRWDCTKQRFTLHVFNCPVQLSFDPSLGACNWPSQGPSCQGDTLLTNNL